jgi:hypothetical protein
VCRLVLGGAQFVSVRQVSSRHRRAGSRAAFGDGGDQAEAKGNQKALRRGSFASSSSSRCALPLLFLFSHCRAVLSHARTPPQIQKRFQHY